MKGLKAPCLVCGRTTLMVPGRTAYFPVHMWFAAWWEDPVRILDGTVHFTCVRSATYRDAFRDEVVDILTKGRHSITLPPRDTPEPVTIERDVSPYAPGPVFSGADCQVFTSPDGKRFLVVEHSGPFHTLGPKEARAVAAGNPAYHTYFGMDVKLEQSLVEASEEKQPSFAHLVEWLGISDCYPDAEAVELTEYRYNPDRRRLRYGTKAAWPIPDEAAEAIKNLLAA